MKEKGITYLFPAKIREILEKTGFNLEELYEIRLRVNAPMIVILRWERILCCERRKADQKYAECLYD